MKCKAGDMAVIVKSEAGNEGRIVNVVRLAVGEEVRVSMPAPQWMVDPIGSPLNWCFPGGPVQPMARGELAPFADAWLMPIGNPTGADETLLWAGLPAPIVRKAEKVDA